LQNYLQTYYDQYLENGISTNQVSGLVFTRLIKINIWAGMPYHSEAFLVDFL
jgi:hypothetical protein